MGFHNRLNGYGGIEMMGITRGLSTLIGAAVAGFLVWLSTQTGNDGGAEYWTTYGLLAAAGLTIAISQILGGWTKWGWPRLSGGVFLLGFLPVLVAGGWVLLSRQPSDFFNTSNWSRDLGINGIVGDLGEALSAIAFGLGLTFGLCFDTSGPRRVLVNEESGRARPMTGSTVQAERSAIDDPVTEDRLTEGPVTLDKTRPIEETGRRRLFGRSREGDLRSGDRDDT